MNVLCDVSALGYGEVNLVGKVWVAMKASRTRTKPTRCCEFSLRIVVVCFIVQSAM